MFEIQLTFRNFLKIKESLHDYYEVERAGMNVQQLLSKPIFKTIDTTESFEGFGAAKEVDPVADPVAWLNVLASRMQPQESFDGFN